MFRFDRANIILQCQEKIPSLGFDRKQNFFASGSRENFSFEYSIILDDVQQSRYEHVGYMTLCWNAIVWVESANKLNELPRTN